MNSKGNRCLENVGTEGKREGLHTYRAARAGPVPDNRTVTSFLHTPGGGEPALPGRTARTCPGPEQGVAVGRIGRMIPSRDPAAAEDR